MKSVNVIPMKSQIISSTFNATLYLGFVLAHLSQNKSNSV